MSIYLCRLISQLDLHFAALCAEPQEHLLPVIQNHDIVIGQIVLTEVRTLLGNDKVPLLVGAPEQTGVLHVIGVRVIRFPTTERHPEEVVGLLALGEHLQTHPRTVEHLLGNLLDEARLVRIGFRTNPNVHDARVALLEWHIKDVAKK